MSPTTKPLFLLQAQVDTHAFVWGRPADVVIAGENPWPYHFLPGFAHPYWVAQLERSPETLSHAALLSRSIAPTDLELDTAGLANLTADIAGNAVHELASFSTRTELRAELAAVLHVESHKITISDEQLGPAGRNKIARQLAISGDKRLTVESALEAVAILCHKERASVYRIKSGRAFLEYEPPAPAMWRPNLYDDPQPVEVPRQEPSQWQSTLYRLIDQAEVDVVVA